MEEMEKMEPQPQAEEQLQPQSEEQPQPQAEEQPQSQVEERPRPQAKKRPQPPSKKKPQPQAEEEPQPQAEERLERVNPLLPANHGWWVNPNTAGNCDWMFDLTSQRPDIYHGGYTTWGNLLQQTPFPAADRVTFNRNYPDFSPYLIQITNNQHRLFVDADFAFPAGSRLTSDRLRNFRQADGWVAQAVRSTPGDIAYLRRDRKFTWHELETCDRMLLVPRAIHGNVPHSGGIEVLNNGGIGSVGAESAASPQLEERMIGGKKAVCGGGICQIMHPFSGRGSSDDIELLFYCDDEAGNPTQAQVERMEILEQDWLDVEQAAWDSIQTYVNNEYGSGGESAKLVTIVVFPEDTTMWKIDIGIYYDNFDGDPEHGLGVRILGDQDDSMIVGPGDVAL